MKPAALVLCGLLAGCNGNVSPVTPGPSTVALSGTVTATNGGQALAGIAVDLAGQHTLTDSIGAYHVTVPSGRYTAMLSGSGILPRTLLIDIQTPAALPLDAITTTGGFDLAFYREFVRNGHEAPAKLEPLRRWTTAPSFDIQTTDDTGAAIDPALRATVHSGIAAIVPLLTGGQFSATFGSGVPVRFTATRKNGFCGESPIGPTGAFILIHYTEPCLFSRTARHETGHVLGFWHTDNPADLMFVGGFAEVPSARERYHAAIAYKRPVGNRDLDDD